MLSWSLEPPRQGEGGERSSLGRLKRGGKGNKAKLITPIIRDSRLPQCLSQGKFKGSCKEGRCSAAAVHRRSLEGEGDALSAEGHSLAFKLPNAWTDPVRQPAWRMGKRDFAAHCDFTLSYHDAIH
jgi:hypothetical protein